MFYINELSYFNPVLYLQCTRWFKRGELVLFSVLTIFNEGAYLTFKSIFHRAFNLF